MSSRASSSSSRAKATLFLAISAITLACGYWAYVSAMDSSPLRARLTVTGSSTIAPLIAEIAARYEAENPGVRIDVQTGGSTRGIVDVRQGLSGLGMASRELKPNETDGLETHVLAIDGIGMIVHKDNPVTELSSEQIKAIFLGEIQNWKELGGDDREIAVINKASGRGTLTVFLNHFQIKEADIEADVIVGENQQAILTVNQNVAAIGYVSIGAAEAEIQRGSNLKLITLDGVLASTETVSNGLFPVSRNLNLITPSQCSTTVQQFLDYALSRQVDDLVKAQYFVPLKN